MNIEVRVFLLLAHLAGTVVCSGDDYSHCTKYGKYNMLANLMERDECLNVDAVFKLLVEINTHSELCRTHIIHLLAVHFGPHASTPDHCQCRGVNKLQQYHIGPGDGVNNLRDTCIKNHHSYSDLYYQFFESSHRNDHVMACRTHHSVWSALGNISTSSIRNNSCQKDIIFHLKYAFGHHHDNCSCTEATHHADSHQGHEDDKCYHYDSFNKLMQLGETDGCLSANSAWHYLDALQAKDPECRKRIQKHLADKYEHRTSQHRDNCICYERRNLVNQRIHQMDNGSFHSCRGIHGSPYRTIEADLFSKIREHGCLNHNYLWNKLNDVEHYCPKHHNSHCTKSVDCQQDLIVRAAIEYPTEDSDSCVCSQITSSSVSTTPTSTTKAITPLTTPSNTPWVNTSTTPTTEQLASATSVRVTRRSTTVMSTQRSTPALKFTCNKLRVLEDLAKSLKVTDPNSSYCDPDAGGSDDAYVLSTCDITSPMTWKKGENVLADCMSNKQLIPTYTPISTFDGDNYAPLGAMSGIFLGCYNSGIKIAIQRCNGVPEIVHIENGSFAYNPKNYYVIV